MSDLPPIFRGRMLTLVSIAREGRSTVFVFRDEAPYSALEDRLIQVVVEVHGKPTYQYALWSPETNTVLHYAGAYGDPSRDPIHILKGGPDS